MNHFVFLLIGVACAGAGGDLFVRGTIGLAQWCRLSPGLIAATFAAFATSAPEFFVSTQAALSGTPQLGLGDALGSNVVNVALILALSLTISGIRYRPDSLKRDFRVALCVPVFTLILFLDGNLSRWDGFLMLGLFLGWSLAAMQEARKQRDSAKGAIGANRKGRAILHCILGIALLVAAGRLIVQGARGIALSAGIHEFIIGQTIVAIGTSMPELATTLIAKLKGHDEVGLGTVLGSNIFNGLFIVGVAAMIHPITVSWKEVRVALIFGLAALILLYPGRKGFLGRKRGFALLAIYGSYLFLVLWGISGS